MDKKLYIICGCNGAGKTTASYTVLPDILQCKEFVNADEIARGLFPFNPAEMAIEAGRLMLKRIKELLGKDETTRRRYVTGINNLFNLYAPEVDCWYAYDNSVSPRILIAQGGRLSPTMVQNNDLFTQTESYVR